MCLIDSNVLVNGVLLGFNFPKTPPLVMNVLHPEILFAEALSLLSRMIDSSWSVVQLALLKLECLCHGNAFGLQICSHVLIFVIITPHQAIVILDVMISSAALAL